MEHPRSFVSILVTMVAVTAAGLAGIGAPGDLAGRLTAPVEPAVEPPDLHRVTAELAPLVRRVETRLRSIVPSVELNLPIPSERLASAVAFGSVAAPGDWLTTGNGSTIARTEK
jgi:hypothetical protein